MTKDFADEATYRNGWVVASSRTMGTKLSVGPTIAHNDYELEELMLRTYAQKFVGA